MLRLVVQVLRRLRSVTHTPAADNPRFPTWCPCRAPETPLIRRSLSGLRLGLDGGVDLLPELLLAQHQGSSPRSYSARVIAVSFFGIGTTM